MCIFANRWASSWASSYMYILHPVIYVGVWAVRASYLDDFNSQGCNGEC